MRLTDYLCHRGNVFFRWRSYTPLLLIPMIWLERKSIHYPYGNHEYDLIYEFVSFALALLGIAVRIKTIGHIIKGTSGRNTRQQATQLNTTGMYSIVRNPLYLGNFLLLFGATLLTQSWELIIINSFLFGLAYTPIIMQEEEYLTMKFGDEYKSYLNNTPCFIPKSV